MPVLDTFTVCGHGLKDMQFHNLVLQVGRSVVWFVGLKITTALIGLIIVLTICHSKMAQLLKFVSHLSMGKNSTRNFLVPQERAMGDCTPTQSI